MNTTHPDNSRATMVVDFDQLQSACGGDSRMIRELADLYFQQAGEILPALQQAIEQSDVGQVNHLAHKLAGSSLACGLSSVVPSLRRLEGTAKEGRLHSAHESLAEIPAQMTTIRQQFQDYLRRCASQP